MKLGNDNLRMRGRVTAVADGRSSIAAASDKMFAIFDAATGECRHRAFKSQHALAFSHDDTLLAVGEFNASVIDLQTFQPRWEVWIGSSVRDIQWSPDQRVLALGSHERLVLLDAITGTVIASVEAQSAGVAFIETGVVYTAAREVRTLSFTGETSVLGEAPSAAFVAIARDAFVVFSWSTNDLVWHSLDGTELARVSTTSRSYERRAADRTCDRIVIATDDVLHMHSRDGIRTIGGLERRFEVLALGDRRLVAGAWDGDLAIIDLDAGSRLETPPAAPSSLAFVADARLACAGDAGAVLRDLANGDVIAELGPYEHVATAGQRILAWGKAGARVFDDMGISIAELTTASIGLGTIAFDGVVALAPTLTTDTPMVFDESGQHLRTHAGNGIDSKYSSSSHSNWSSDDPAVIEGLVFLTPARVLAFYENGTIEYDGEQRIVRPYIPLPKAVALLDEHVVVGSQGYHHIHRIVDGIVSDKAEHVIREMSRCVGLGHLIVFGTDDGRIVLYDVRTGTELGARATHLWGVRALAIDPTASLIASSADDGTLIVQALGSGIALP
ncbi:MAG: WD40 repeat domain-containing protein [Kofleriaceae bacterium]